MTKYSHVFAALFIVSLQACSSSGSSVASSSNEDNTGKPGELSNASPQSIPADLPEASRAMVFDYIMKGVTGEPVVARAQLFEPKTPVPADGHPLVVWAHGTTGIANACQPSTSFETFSNETAIGALLASGYAVLAPDYEGFGTDRIHPYYQRASHANAVVNAIPAVHKIDGIILSDAWAVVGHSQGGHVAMSAARATAMPAYPLQAVVALAPGTDLKPFSDRAFEAIDEKIAEGDTSNAVERLFYLNVYSAYVAHALKEVNPGFDPKSIFGETIAQRIDIAVDESFCGRYAGTVQLAISQHFTAGGTVEQFQGLNRNWYAQPAIAARLAIDAFADEAQSAPLLIIQGDADRQVPVAATTAFVDRQRAVGTDITYNIIAGARHGDVARAEFDRVISWLNDRFPPQ